ncbi:MAG: hypothetical protein ACSLEM_06305 [Candidatus Malihini olakiniferum]
MNAGYGIHALTVCFLANGIDKSAAVLLHIRWRGARLYDCLGGQQRCLNTLGYVSVPAVVLISAMSFFTVPFSACLAHRLLFATLKKIFAAFAAGAESESTANGVYRVS